MKNNKKSLSRTKSIHSAQPFYLKLLPVLVASCLACGNAIANPSNPVIVQIPGQPNPSIVSNGNILSITNSGSKAFINWQSFNINQGETTQFVQGPNSATLNRVIGPLDPSNRSMIMGTLQGSGSVYLINPNGITFGNGSMVDVGAGKFFASTIDMPGCSDPANLAQCSFVNGINQFGMAGAPISGRTIEVSPGASITSNNGGQIFLISPNINNQGIIRADGGQILLAAGYSILVADSTDPGMHVVVSNDTDQALNTGTIQALSGKIGIYGAMVSLSSGTVNADKAVAGSGGEIVLKSSGDLALNSTVSVAGGKLVLNSTAGNITQSAPITASSLAAIAKGDVVLNNAGNQVPTIAGSAGGPNGFSFYNNVGLNVSQVGPIQGISIAAGATVALTAPNGVNIGSPINAEGGTVQLSAPNIGSVSQSGNGIINASALLATAKSNVTLNLNNNVTGTVAGTSGPNFILNNSNSFNVGTVGTTKGITAALGNTANIQLTSGGSINTVGDAKIDSDNSLNLTAATGLGTQANPLLTSVNNLTATNGSNDIVIKNAINNSPFNINAISQNNGGIYIDSSGPFLTTNVVGPVVINNSGPGSNIVLTHTSLFGPLQINGAITAEGGSVGLVSSTDILGGPTGSITAASLSANASQRTVNLAGINNITTISGTAKTSFNVVGTGTSLVVGKVDQIGTGSIFAPLSNGITVNGPVSLTASIGDMTVNAPITVNANAGAGNINLSSLQGSILQGASSDAKISTTGTLTLSSAGNIGASGTGALVTDVGTLTIPQTNNVFLLNNGTGNLTLSQVLAYGSVNINQLGSLTVPNVTTSNMTTFTGTALNLVAGGDVNIGDGNVFIADGGSGPINLYAGYIGTPGTVPTPNGNTGATITASPTALFQANPRNFVTPPIPVDPIVPPAPIMPPAPGIQAAAANYVDGLNSMTNYLLNDNQQAPAEDLINNKSNGGKDEAQSSTSCDT